MTRWTLTIAMCVLVTLTARQAAAQKVQAWTDRGYVNVNVGFESKSEQLDGSRTLRIYDEDGSLSASQTVDSGAFFDIGFGARVWQNASVGLALHRGSSSGDATISGSIPHPIFFNRNRSVSASAADLSRTEQAAHLQFGYMLPVNEKFDVHVFGGPSFFKVFQDVVTNIEVRETSGSFTTVEATPTIEEHTDTAVGINIGADATYHVYKSGRTRVGVGGFIRYAAAKGELQVLQSTVDTDLGGFQVGFGARIRF